MDRRRRTWTPEREQAALEALRAFDRAGYKSSPEWKEQRPAGAPGLGAIYGHWGSWPAFRKAAGLGDYPHPQAVSNEKMIADLRACAEEIGKTPTGADYEKWRLRHGATHSSQSGLRKRWGNWAGAIKAAGLPPLPRPDRRTPSGGRAYRAEEAAKWSTYEHRAIFAAARTLCGGTIHADDYERLRARASRPLPEWEVLLDGMKWEGHDHTAQPPAAIKSYT